jgi:putative transposase
VKANRDQRSAERTYGIAGPGLTPSLSWSHESLVNYVNEWKDGQAHDAPVTVLADGSVVRGLPWREEVSAYVFECASVNAAQALANWTSSRSHARAGKPVGFPNFKPKRRTRPEFVKSSETVAFSLLPVPGSAR